ncbi:Retrovirus-related Pol polyprotein from transposon RE1 (Retro element 1) (AtRE1) [Includes: Protease RE1 [Durusdinium trenchii]|uniref:Retrovirus-related Pol polyprotein from transposon RE1 (Retro element 1) (AtRE1) n=1 Tax=Durusdinium trenchii TaxID=1381693 RepID=A0ABP0NFD1_9DINO
MATMMEKKEQVATWNGDPTTWLEYVKRVRLQFERTEKKRRCLLGAELASRLTGRAWDIVSAEVDHSQLQKRDGAAYLLRFLEERLCKAPVPDTGQRLEDFFLRLRRTPGSSMAEWATQVRESYRRLQRAMARQRKDLADRDGQLRERAMSSTHSNPGHRRQSDVTTPKAPTASVESASPGFPATDSGNGQTDRPDDPRETDEPDRGAYENRHWRRDDAMSWTAWEEDEEEDPVIEWEQFDLGSERILPDEILGWILLRRSGLPANARLSVLSATNNRLDLASMERAMRDQEEELLAAEAHRSRGDLPRPRRSFWVEEDAHWGLLSEVDIEDVDDNVFWVGERLPPDVYSAPADEGSAWSTWLPDGQELSWEWHEDDFYASDAAGIFWSWSETKTWLDMCDAPTSDGDPLQEAYAAFQDRFRTFKESRALNSAKHLSRGFYPLGQMKGKFMQAKGKGKGKSKTKNPPNSSLATSTVALYAGGAKGAPSGQKPAPARSLYAAAVFMVSSEQADEIADVTFPTGDVLATLAAQFPGHAVLDSGATESIASLEAMHEVMELRASIHGPEHFVVHAQQKRFRFGNGSIQHAVSFVELPQIVAGKHVKLGVHALDAPGIPLLLSVKTLTTLRAVIDFDEGLICFKEVDPSVWIKLKRASNGHLLLDLTKDWLSDRPDSCLTVHDLHDPEPAPMYKAALADDTTSCEKNVFENVHTTPPTLQEPLHDRHERMSHDVFDGVCHEESHAVFEHVLPALATTPVPKTTTKKKGTRVPTPEKYDMSRREGPDGRDSRAQGFPCYGNHTPMPEGRGSLSGRNGHGKWTVCTLCRLRIEYVPAYGAKGCYRQPGPLAPDVTTVMEQVKDDIKDKPEVRENLNMKMASTLGAEASLRKKLEVLENDKIKLQSKARARPEAVKQEQDVVLNASAPKKTLKRENVQESEEQETAEWEKIYGKLTPLQQESLVTSADHYQQEAEETFEVLFNTSSQDTEEIIAMIHDLRPKMMWISLPCGPYSPIQHIFNQATPEQEAALLLKKKRSRKLIRNALRLVKTQLEEGGHVCWEWPQNNGGWRLPELKVLYDLMNQFKETHHAHIHGCAFGVKNAVGVPLKKPWKVVCTSPSMAAALTRRCPGNHEHAECIGGQDARNSGFYPEAMCRTIFRTVQSMNHSLDGGAFAESFPIFDDTLMEDEKELNLEKPLSDSERKMAMQTLAKLHRRTGHPSNHALSGCLKHRGAHHEVIEMAKKYQCPECQELRLAELNPSGALQRSRSRNPGTPGPPGVAPGTPRAPQQQPVSLSRLARDPRYTPEPVPKPRTVPELFEQPIFKKQRRLHQSEDEAMMVSDTMTTPMEDLADYACVLYLDLPSKANEWRKMRRTPINYFVKKVRGAKIQWHKLDPTEKKKFMEAKHLEVQQWLTASAVKRITGDYPKDRLVRMRWVLTYKENGAAKGRIVLIGFEDPDLGSIQSSAPTMSKRTRQLALQYSSIMRWRLLKGDVKSAFLQGDPDEADRALYARPVPELAEALHMKENEVVQVLKSCYGLVNAPANWYLCIRRTLAELNFTQSRSDPCLWFYYMETGDPERPKELAGYICSHVDDFIISGNEECEQWVEALQAFHGRFRWSPWEHQNFLHCGIRIREEPDSSFTLDHSAYCEAIEQITYTTKNEHEPLTKDEMSQLRGALGALQWRAQQTAPHLMARLGQLQSSITKANIETIKATNKLIRENFQHRYLSARINQLGVEDPRSVHFVAWSDAALANRIDLSSTGGFLIAATSEKMLLGERAPLTLVSWRSSRLARKARSSLAAETQAMSEADQELLFARLAWAEFCAFEVDLKASEKAISQIPGTVVTDAKALFDILLKSDLNSAAAGLRDKYSALEVLCLLESLAKLGTKARWVHSPQRRRMDVGFRPNFYKRQEGDPFASFLCKPCVLDFATELASVKFIKVACASKALFRDIQLARAKLQEQGDVFFGSRTDQNGGANRLVGIQMDPDGLNADGWSGPGCTLRVVSFRIHWFNDRPDAPTRRDGVAGEESETPSAKPRVGEKVEVFSNSARRFFGTSLPSNWTLEEVEFYDRLFADLNSKSDTCSSRPDTGIDPLASLQSEYLEQCGLPRRALREIWQVANPHLKTSLGLEEFRASCRLVGHCQAMSLQDEKVFRRLRSGGGGLRADLRSHCLGEPPVRLPDFTLKEGSLPASAKNSRKAFGETGSNSSWFLMVHACSCILQIWSPGYTILHNLCDLPLGTQTGWSRPAGVDFSICRQWRDSAG